MRAKVVSFKIKIFMKFDILMLKAMVEKLCGIGMQLFLPTRFLNRADTIIASPSGDFNWCHTTQLKNHSSREHLEISPTQELVLIVANFLFNKLFFQFSKKQFICSSKIKRRPG